MSCMSYTCHVKLKDLPPSQNRHVLSVHSATGHDPCSMGLVQHNVLSYTQFMHTLTVCRNT